MFAAIWIPRFRLQAAMRWRELPPALALVDTTDARSVVLEATLEAVGVHPGITPAQALARCPALTILPRSLEQETTARALLLETAFAFSPRVEQTATDLVTLDLTSAAKGACWQRTGEEALMRLRAMGLEARAGFAAHPDHAALASRCGEPVNIVYDGATFARELPVEALEPDAKTVAILHDWGIRTVGQLLRLPKSATVERLGAGVEALWQRASARRRRVLRLAQPTETFFETFEFEYPVETIEPLLFLVRRFLDALCVRVCGCFRVVGKMRFALGLETGHYERDFAVPAPTTDVEALYRIIDTHLETLRLEEQPRSIRLELVATQPLGRQLDLFAQAIRDPSGFGETLARLQAVNGDNSVGTPVATDTHRPDAFSVEPFSDEAGKEAEESVAFGIPLRRFRPPISVRVRAHDAEPAWIDAPDFDGPIIRRAGPFRLSGDWWAPDGWSIEEWDAEVEGRGLVRLGRRGNDWWLEGTYNVCLIR